ncbi:MAG: phage minor head protein [Bacillota bacterium]
MFSFESMSFSRAIEYFRDKVLLTQEQFEALIDEYKTKAFAVAGIASLDVLNDIYQALLKALEEGLTIKEFRELVQEIPRRKGWEGLLPYRIDNIFRTNVQTAYNVGRYRQMSDPDVIKRRPYWMYDAVNDKRTRPTHRALDGMVFPADHPFWDTWYPPNGYRCRCGVRSLSERDLKRLGLEVRSEVPAMVEPPGQPARPLLPDPGFAYNPAKVAWEPDLKKYPEPLREAYRRKRGG